MLISTQSTELLIQSFIHLLIQNSHWLYAKRYHLKHRFYEENNLISFNVRRCADPFHRL